MWSGRLTLLLVFIGHLSQVAVVVALHLQVEDFALYLVLFLDQMIVEQRLQIQTAMCSKYRCVTTGRLREKLLLSQQLGRLLPDRCDFNHLKMRYHETWHRKPNAPSASLCFYTLL